jgi:DNA polymerase-3 subunit delta'
VRAFVSTVYLTPNELDFKVYIFEDADRLTPQAQNALLKIIEEPHYGVYIFLLCENPGALLQTVRSRVISINMQTFSAEQTYAFLEKEGLSYPDERGDFAVRMSRGAFGAVKEFISEESKDFGAYKKACEVISALSKKNRSVAYFDLLSLVSGAADTSDALALLLKYLLIIYRDIFSAQNSEDIELVLLDDDTAVHYASLFSVSTVIRALEIASEVQGNMRFNTNIGLSAVYLAENLWRIT